MTIETIDQVIERLTEIVQISKQRSSRNGYFAALYLKVTLAVKAGIEAGHFDDGPRMERLDVVFASRYLDAYDEFQGGGAPSESWRFAFDEAEHYWPIVLQHLLFGINAHINLDLGIAAAKIAGRDGLPSLHDDFNRINGVLASLVGGVKQELAQVWWVLGILDRFLGNVEDQVINFSMTVARDEAWAFAVKLAALDEDAWPEAIGRRDRETLEIARLVRYPGIVLSGVNKLIRLGERGTVPEIIEILAPEKREGLGASLS